MTLTEALLILGTVAGPVLAVQAQKWIERSREARSRREQVFKILMATRAPATRLGLDHVQALNMIDIEFSPKSYAGVREAWASYRDHLTPTSKSGSEAEAIVWSNTADELFTNLLFEMGKALEFKFDKVTLKRGAYIPTALGETDSDLNEIRRSLRSLLSGNHALKMDVVNFPEMEDSESQKLILDGIRQLLGRADHKKDDSGN
ncbi:MAG: DUF6680 family protein [Pyrinomonadaceae bacterium]